ncbi:lymphotoxin-alpha [Chaetodon trifascialis]|uniref:lymphotoxin-alpha n=1 Tax=Chaetodon trifascialis TaxID=109706 RepID=UPI003990E8A9
MECQSRSSYKYLLLQVWCGLLTVAMVVMAALVTSIKPKSTEDGVATLKSDVSPTGSSPSYIELVRSIGKDSWETSNGCEVCSLVVRDNTIYFKKESVYFIYAQVTFSKHNKENQTNYVMLKKNPSFGKSTKKLIEGTFPHTTERSVWVARMVKLTKGDSVSLNITGDYQKDSARTFWGAYELH